MEAAEYFTTCFEISDNYDPLYKKRALIELKDIFWQSSIDTKEIDYELNKFSTKNIDIIFALDISEQISDNHLEEGYQLGQIIFEDILRSQDKMCYVQYNKETNLNFGLIEKSKLEHYVKKELQEKPM